MSARLPDDGVRALAPLIRPLPVSQAGPDGRWMAADLRHGCRLILAGDAVDRAEMIALSPVAAAPLVSRSATRGWRGALTAPAGRAGLDIEALGRVAANTSAHDAWLAPRERAHVEAAAMPVLELACRWCLKEAYGKALGVGLALPLDRLWFGARAGRVVLAGDAALPLPKGWHFGLYRHGDLIAATACRLSAQAIPLAPIGRNPPTLPVDR